ncbi:hypothetical protein CDEST_00942 [Colletotrichum destructivum]|uniref:Uncharacterized protein n=1 Tax=Colletotrichum destructivum TaxID=34406 RepID=A0AAX4HYK6_9PEZI|nr:hypothetical protein CDEST_00942 [Colletotrichum destructivum]
MGDLSVIALSVTTDLETNSSLAASTVAPLPESHQEFPGLPPLLQATVPTYRPTFRLNQCPGKSLPDRHNAELTTRQTCLACFPCAVFQSHAQTTPISCHPTDPSHASKSPTARRAGPPPAVAVAVAKWPWSRSPRSKRNNRNLLSLLQSLPRLCYPLLAHRPTFPRRRCNTTFPSRWPWVGNARLRRPDCL